MPAEHLLQLFDTIEARAESLSAFVNQCLADDEDVVLFATADHWKAVDERLYLTGRRIGSAIADGRLMVVDACETLDEIMRRGEPDPVQFSACVARALPENGGSHSRGMRVYGELVDLLAEEGNFAAAIALEGLWNDLLNARRFTLMCGYCSAHFATPGAGSALRDICGCHHGSRVPRMIHSAHF